MSQAIAIRLCNESNAALPSDLSEAEQTLRREVHTILKQANFDYQRRQYNTVVSAAMKMLNTVEPVKLSEAKDDGQAIRPAVLRECIGILLRMLYPVVPHLTHRLWMEMGYSNQGGLILDAPWPIVDEAALVRTEMELVLQVNGKLRGAITVPADASKEVIEAAALQSEIVLKALNGGSPKKVIVVPGRLVNIVV
jgi:leucyl-tRNA synthetase